VNSINAGLALVAGIISITSPCCLPLLPGYIGYLTGASGRELEERRWRTVATAVLFTAGFSVIFVGLGATASQLGALLLTYRVPLGQLAGVLIVGMGLVLLLEGRVALFSRGGDWSRWAAGGRLWTAPLLGAAFAITWTPCIGPVLGAILTLAGSTANLQAGVALLGAYSLGLALPLVAVAFAAEPVGRRLGRLGRVAGLVQAGAGVVLLAMGVLLITDRWLPLVAPVLSLYAKLHWPPI
jgi:cytochrome c-type biogenesis protein